MRWLTSQQARDLRQMVEDHIGTLQLKLIGAAIRKDAGAVAFYTERIQHKESLLLALPSRGTVAIEDDLDEEADGDLRQERAE